MEIQTPKNTSPTPPSCGVLGKLHTLSVSVPSTSQWNDITDNVQKATGTEEALKNQSSLLG